MSVKVVYESEACDCCLLWVADNDDSSCRDYSDHKHRHAKVSKRVIRQIAEEYPVAVLASVPGAHNV